MWEVFPSRASKPGNADSFSRTSLKDSPFENGWLCFESVAGKRRLAPIPAGWEFAPVAQLDKLCHEAELVPARRRVQYATESNAAPGAA